MSRRSPVPVRVLIDAEVPNGSASFAVSNPMLPGDRQRFLDLAELLPAATWRAIPVHPKDRRSMSTIVDSARKRWAS